VQYQNKQPRGANAPSGCLEEHQGAQRALMAHFQESSEPAHAWHFLDNKVSRKVLRSVGFRDDGETMMDWQGGAQMPAMMMRMSAEDFADALEVRTRRCQITRMREEDLPELHRIVTNPEVAHMLLRFSPEMTVDEVGALLRPAMNPLERPMRMAIRHEGKCIGSIGVNDGPWPLMFYFLAPEYWGQGFASEIVPEFCDAVQDWFRLEELIAAVFNDNLASRRILEKAGFHVDSTHSAKSAGRDAVAEGWLMRRVG